MITREQGSVALLIEGGCHHGERERSKERPRAAVPLPTGAVRTCGKACVNTGETLRGRDARTTPDGSIGRPSADVDCADARGRIQPSHQLRALAQHSQCWTTRLKHHKAGALFEARRAALDNLAGKHVDVLAMTYGEPGRVGR